MCNEYFINSRVKVETAQLSTEDIAKLAKRSTTDFFFVINTDELLNLSVFDFSFCPIAEDSKFIHIWNKDNRVRMYNKELVLLNPAAYNDLSLTFHNIKSKVDANKVYKDIPYDIVFLSYDEALADYNYNQLLERFPRAKRVHGVKGIFNAHFAAANIAETAMFYAVDADAIVEPTFNFDFVPARTDAVYVWRSRNPVNDLMYGYGGVKLFPTTNVLEYNKLPIDFTTSVSPHFKPVEVVSNITKFNTDPFSAWRSGFRECTKLASKLIHNQKNSDTEERLEAWCTKGADREFGKCTLAGANAGKAFGIAQKDKPDMLGLINDYAWLEQQFKS